MPNSHTQILALIPARGGSKGLPGKNIRPLAGRSLIQWVAEAYTAAQIPGSQLLLSTDDEGIAAAGRACGIAVPFMRPAALATDSASSVDVALHALDWYVATHGYEPAVLMLLQATVPFTTAATIRNCVQMLTDHPELDAVISTLVIERKPEHLYRLTEAGTLQSIAAPSTDTDIRRQAIRGLHTPNGGVYCIRSAALRTHRGFLPPQLGGVAVSKPESIDIDTQDDWDMAEAVAARR